jgi:hypothetical protein
VAARSPRPPPSAPRSCAATPPSTWATTSGSSSRRRNSAGGGISIVAATQVAAADEGTLSTGAVIDGAGVSVTIDADVDSLLSVGEDGYFQSTGDIGFGTFTRGFASTLASTSTYGLANVGVAHATTLLRSDQSVTVGSRTTIDALGNVDLKAGSDPRGRYDTALMGTAVGHAYVYGLIIVPVGKAVATVTSHTAVRVETGAIVRSGLNATLAAAPGLVAPNAEGVGHGFIVGFIPTEKADSTPTPVSSSAVHFAGTLTAGAYGSIDVTIANCRNSGPACSTLTTVPGSSPFTATFHPAFECRPG